MKKIIVVQLPFHKFISSELQYDDSSLGRQFMSYVSDMGKALGEVIALPNSVELYGSDSLIEQKIYENNGDIVFFVTTLWNYERHWTIAQNLHEGEFAGNIFFCGPAAHRMVNVESKFSSISQCLEVTSTGGIAGIFDDSIVTISRPLSSCIKPTLSNDVNVDLSYYKYRENDVAVHPLKKISSLLRTGNVEEITISKCLDLSDSTTVEALRDLKNMKHEVTLLGEISTKGVSDEKAALLFDAGFSFVSVELQSLHSDTSTSEDSNTLLNEDVQAVDNLLQRGIDCIVNIRAGYEGQTLSQLGKIVDRFADEELQDCLEFRLVDDFTIDARGKITFIKECQSLSHKEIEEIREYVLRVSEAHEPIVEIPDFVKSEKESTIYNGVAFKGSDSESWEYRRYDEYIHTSPFTFHIDLIRPRLLYKGLETLLPQENTNLFNIVLYTDRLLEEDKITAFAEKHLNNRVHEQLYQHYSVKEKSVFRFYQVTQNIGKYEQVIKKYTFIDPIFLVNEETKEQFLNRKDREELLTVLITEEVFHQVKEFVVEEYAEYFDKIAFEVYEHKKEFFALAGIDSVDYPFAFSIKDLTKTKKRKR